MGKESNNSKQKLIAITIIAIVIQREIYYSLIDAVGPIEK
jgi:hypothetical protein